MKSLLLHAFFSIHIIFTGQVFASELPKPLVETDWLADNLEQVSIIDVRSSSHSFYANPVFEKNVKSGKWELVRLGGHIPGANLVLYDNVRGSEKIEGKEIKYILPGKTAFEQLMQNAGINQDSKIVVVTNSESDFDLTMAARMYWQIKYYGHNEVSILDGGTSQWLMDGRDVATSTDKTPRGNWVVQNENTDLLATSEEVLAATNDNAIQIVDVRPLGQYLGTYKSSKVKEKGHIPTAKPYPVDLIASRSAPVKFSSESELRQLTQALNVDLQTDTITYCNSGHMASGAWFVFSEILGMDNTRLYDGSMHQWTTEKRPVVTMKVE